jgi:hypothetical protein
MGKTYVMSGIMDWLKADSIRKAGAKKRDKSTRESIQQKIMVFRKTDKETSERSNEPSEPR